MVNNPLFWGVFWRFLRNYVPIIVNIISNNTVTILFALDICLKKKTPPTDSVHWGLNPSPPQQAVITFLVSEETKFEVNTTSTILSYLCHFGNVN